MEGSRQIEEAAAEWLARRDSGEWTDADETAFNQWLDASTANRVAFLRLDTVWQQANRLRALGAGLQPGAVPASGEWRQPPFFEATREEHSVPLRAAALHSQDANAASEMLSSPAAKAWIYHSWRALAATLLLAAALGVTYHLRSAGPSYRTPVGGLAAVPMPDGSKITLNTNSEVRVAVTDAERRVELAQGEAFFEVARDPNRPFIVEAGNQRFIAVGTKFSVRRGNKANRLVVTEGRVRVETRPAFSEGASASPPTDVSAGGVAHGGEAGILVEEKALAETELLLSWRRGYLVFKNTTLAEAVAEFNRYNTSRIVIEDAPVAGIRIGGHFRSTNVEAFVRLLEVGFPIRVERQGERIVLSQL